MSNQRQSSFFMRFIPLLPNISYINHKKTEIKRQIIQINGEVKAKYFSKIRHSYIFIYLLGPARISGLTGLFFKSS